MNLNSINQLVLSHSEMAQIWQTQQVVSILSVWVADFSGGTNQPLSHLLLARPSNSRPVTNSLTQTVFKLNQATHHNGSTTPSLIPPLQPTNLSTLSTPQLSLSPYTLVTSGKMAAFHTGVTKTSLFRELLKTTLLTISTTRPASVLLPQLLMLSTQRATVLHGLSRPTTCGTLRPIFRITPSLVTIIMMKTHITTMSMLPFGSHQIGILTTAQLTSTAHKTSGQYHGQMKLTPHSSSKTTGNMVFSDQTTEVTTWASSLL